MNSWILQSCPEPQYNRIALRSSVPLLSSLVHSMPFSRTSTNDSRSATASCFVLHDAHCPSTKRSRMKHRLDDDSQDDDQRAIQLTVTHLLGPVCRQKEQYREHRTLFVQTALVTFECSLDEGNQEPGILVTTIDISSGGIGLLSSSAFPCKQVVLHISDVQVVAKVQWCRTVNDRLFRYGLRLVKLVGDRLSIDR